MGASSSAINPTQDFLARMGGGRLFEMGGSTVKYGICAHSVVSLVPRLSCVGGEKRAWYTLFVHAQFSQDFWEFGNFP